MEQSICIFYANVPIFAPLDLSPLIIANPISAWPHVIKGIWYNTCCLALHYKHNSQRMRTKLFTIENPFFPLLPIVWEDSTDHKTVKHNDID